MKKFKKLLAGFMTLAMLVTMLPATVLAEDSKTFTGVTEPQTFAEDATVTLDNVIITAADGVSAISIEGNANVTLVLVGENTLTGGDNGAGIYVAEGASVTITGTGKLTAIGNAGVDDNSGAAGIGGTWANGNSGAITIDGAEVVAEGYGVHGSGIGSGDGKVIGEIKIVNKADVTATGGYYVKDGKTVTAENPYGKKDAEGGVAIGGGAKTVSTIANITIDDSEVTAYGGSKAAGIGANFWSSCGTIAITNSTIEAYGGSSSAGIGTSRGGDNGVSANIVISGSKVTAIGGDFGAGIGSGYNNDSLSNLPKTTISISNGAVINATGGMGSAGIGGGYKSGNADITISDSNVDATAGALVREDVLGGWGAKYKYIDRTACAIGSGADGDSGSVFETQSSEVNIDLENNNVDVTAYEGGKKAIEGIENEALGDAYTEEKMPRKGSNSYAYTKEVDGYVRVWGEGGGNAKESFVLKLYSKDELIATTKLNNVGGIIDGDVYVTWNFFYPESNDEYWTTTWEAGHPQSAAQPTKVELYIDGQMVAETAAKMSGADDVNPVVWRELGGVAKTDLVPDVNGEFIIKDLTDLKAFRAMVNSGNTFKGKTVKLDADIDLNNEEWTPIGTSSNKFCGTFNGQNHTISNLRINGGYYQGLFGVANGGSKFMNLTIHNVDIDAKGWVGSLLGRAESGGTIDNVKLTGKVTIDAYYYVGGIVGRNYYGDLTNITVDTEEGSYIYANSVENGTAYRTYVGGVVGWKGEGNNIVKNVTSDIDVTGSTIDVGGIAGIAHYGNSFINVSCSGDVTTLADNVEDACETGGIAGVWNNNGSNITFENLEYTGKLSAPNVEEDFAFPNSGLVGAPYSKTGTGTIVGDIAAVGNQTYKTLAAAMSDAGENDIIYLLGDADISGEGQIVIGKQNKYAFDLGGNELKCDGFLNKGTLNITNGTLICDEFAYSAIESTGTLNVTDVDVTAARHAIRVEGGTAVIDGGTYKTGTVGKTTHAVNVSDGGEVIIKDGTFVGPAAVTGTDSGSAVNCQKDSKVTIENGKFSSGKLNTLAAAGNLTVKGGYFDQDPAAYVAEGYKVKTNEDDTYKFKVTGYSTNIGHGFQTIISDDREAITTTLEDVYAKDSLVVKIYSGNTLLGTTTLKAVDDEGNPMYPATGEYTVNNVINGRESGSWDTVWNVELTRKNVPTKIEVYADGKLTDTYTDADGCFLDEENKTAYVGLFPEIVDVPSSPSGNGGGSTSKKYSVEIDEDIENGSIKLDRTKAKSGTEVTITATPDKGYKLDELKVLNSRGTEIDLEDNGDGTFTFKMPKGGVDIEASFVEGEAESEAPAGEKESLVLTINQVIYQLNGSYAANDVASIIKGDRTMLPIRLIAEFLGATVTWNEAEQSVTIVKDDTTIVIYIDQAFAMVNGEPVQLDAPAFIANDRTYLPLRFIAENLGAEVVWNGANNTVTIYK